MTGAGELPTAGTSRQTEVLRHPPFAWFWSASTVRAFGGAFAGVALQVLIVSVLHATPMQISVLSALGVVPYLLLGFVVGALMDRWRRQRTLVVTSVARAVVFAVVPVLLVTDTLTFWSLAAVVLALGVLTPFADSAAQPLLPRILPRTVLVSANARLSQSETVATTAGPALGGTLVNFVGLPFVFAFEAIVHVVAGLLQSRIRVSEPKPARRAPGHHVGHDIASGLRYTYRHPRLRPLALSVHIWFLGNSIVMTAFAVYALRELNLPPWAYGMCLGVGGIGGFVGAMVSPRLGARFGAGRAILLGRAMVVVPWAVLALVAVTPATSQATAVLVVSASQFVYCLAMGIEDTNDISYRQAVAPDSIQGRMNSTIRTVNRIVFFFGALLAGVLMTVVGNRATFGIGAVVFVVAAVVILLSPMRAAAHRGEG